MWGLAGCLTTCCLSIPLAAANAAAAANLVTNPSFEQSGRLAMPEGWHGDRQVYAIDTQVHRSGKSSLRLTNTDPGRYALCSQKVPLRPGWKCRFGVWVKTKDIQGPESGATICLEWHDANGKWLGGSYPAGIKGTRDWTEIDETTRVSEKAASVTLSCYARRGMTGSAWFDAVQLVRIADPPMRVMLRKPVYRGWIMAQSPENAEVRVELNLRDYDLRPQEVQIHAQLRDRSAKRWELKAQPGEGVAGVLDLAVPVRGLPPGPYDLELRLTGPKGKELQVAHQRLLRVADNFGPCAYIDEHRRLLVHGKLFFPLGMYFSTIQENDLKVYAQSKFNCLMPYGSPTQAQMDLAQRYGLKVIYSVKDWYAGSEYCPKFIRSEADEEPQVRARVRQFRDHPALLAWYLNDELSLKYLPRLEAHQRWVAGEDPDHPTWAVLYQVHDVAAYFDTFDCIGTDPYPIGRKPASMAAQWTAETFWQVAQSRPVWQVPQVHNWANYAKTPEDRAKGRTPTLSEKRSMAWQCICEGATGLVFYSWFDVLRNPDAPFDTQWDELKQIAAEIDRMAPVVLSTEPVPAIGAGGPAAGQAAPRWLHWLARCRQGKLWLIAVSDGDGEGEVSFVLPAEVPSVTVAGEARVIRPEGRVFRDALGRLALHIYEINWKSDGR
jgi:hypothetical protein